MEENNANRLTAKRPGGMTFFLILSFINACWKILSSLLSYFMFPAIAKTQESGELQSIYEPIFTMMKLGEDEINDFMVSLESALAVNVNYHLIIALMFVVSLIGVIMMFRLDKRGLHVYSIAQLCVLIAASFYLYPLQPKSTFTNDLLLTLMLIFIYYTYFKRIELAEQNAQQ